MQRTNSANGKANQSNNINVKKRRVSTSEEIVEYTGPSWKLKPSLQTIVILIAGALANMIGNTLSTKFELPFWLDTFGTIFAALSLGPTAGAVVGAASNIFAMTMSPLNGIYLIANVAIGLVVGIYAIRNKDNADMFSRLTLVVYLVLISVIISVPINMIMRQGYIGNKWGDALFDMCIAKGTSKIFAAIVSEIFMEFPDKLLSMFLSIAIYKGISTINPKPVSNESTYSRFTAFLLGMIITGMLFGGNSISARAEEAINLSDYKVSVFDAYDGLVNKEINAILQTSDGYIWVGTYAGLMVYDGTSFKKLDVCSSVKSVTALYEDSNGYLWIGTNDMGVVCFNHKIGELTVYTVEDGLSSNTIRCITEDDYGNIVVGTVGKASTIRVDGKVSTMNDDVNFTVITHMCVNSDNTITGLTYSGQIFTIGNVADMRDVHVVKRTIGSDETMSCMASNGLDDIIVGTTAGNLYKYENEQLIKFADLPSLGNVEFIKYDTYTGGWFVGGVSSFGYVSISGKYYDMMVPDYAYSSSDALRDKQGNIWFASNKGGICKFSKNPYTNIFETISVDEDTVNAVIKWKDYMLFGCDNGIVAKRIDGNASCEIAELDFLAGQRIRNLLVDSKNNLWISTYSASGLVCVSPQMEITTFSESNSKILGNKIRSAMELKDGTILVASSLGLTFIKNGEITGTIGENEGLKVPQILSLVQTSDGKILAASDGDGIYEIREQQIVGNIGVDEGMDSLVVLRIVPYENGYFYVTSNALYYDDGLKITELNNFPYSNNYDVIVINNVAWIPGSLGIYLVKLEDLIENQPNYPYVLIDGNRGFDTTATANSWNYLNNNELYICASDGAYGISLDNYNEGSNLYNIDISSFKVDGIECYPNSDGKYVIPEGTNRVSISPAILNFELANPIVHIFLEGFENEGIYLNQKNLDDIVYTNVPYGDYTLHIEVLDEMTGEVERQNSFMIFKAASFYETTLFRAYFIFVICLGIIYVTWLITKYFSIATIRRQKDEIAVAKKESEMSFQTMTALAAIIDAKDEYTRGHSARVAEYACMLGEQLGWTKKYIEQLRYAAILHDIGKIGVPDKILNKPGKLNDEEYRIIKQHAAIGGDILKNMPYLVDASEIARHHHERYDGTGYPDGLAGEEIPLVSRVVCIADAYDAMSSKRIYRDPLPKLMIRKELIEGSGTQFDPELLKPFIELLDKGKLNPRVKSQSGDSIIPDMYLAPNVLGSEGETPENLISQIVEGIKDVGSYIGALDIEYYEFSRLHEFIASMSKRYNFKGHLVLVNLKNKYELKLTEDEYNTIATCMDHAICNTIRTTDACTRLSKNQFLIMMIEAGDEENIQIIMDRMISAFYKKYVENRVAVEYEVVEIK